jgi:hypothetical protein
MESCEKDKTGECVLFWKTIHDEEGEFLVKGGRTKDDVKKILMNELGYDYEEYEAKRKEKNWLDRLVGDVLEKEEITVEGPFKTPESVVKAQLGRAYISPDITELDPHERMTVAEEVKKMNELREPGTQIVWG